MSEQEKCQREHGIIERGKVIAVSDGKYTVKSLEREGITTRPIQPLFDGATYDVGDKVTYFVFNDGTGRIICDLQ